MSPELLGPWIPCFSYLAVDHDVCHFGFAIVALSFVIPRPHGEDKVPRVALALPHQEAPVFSFLCQEFLSFSPREMPVKPPGNEGAQRETPCLAFQLNPLVPGIVIKLNPSVHSAVARPRENLSL